MAGKKKAKKEEREEQGTALAVQEKSPEDVVKSKIAGMREMLDATKVESEEEVGKAAELIKNVKKLLTYVKEQKDKLVKPAKEIIAEAGEKYDPAIKECQNAEIVLKGRVQKYLDAQEAKRRLEQQRVADRVERGTMKTETAVRKMDEIGEERKTVSTGSAAVRRVVRRVAVIVAPEQIPDEFWVIDEVRVRREAIARNTANLPQIPGVEIREESTIASV